MEKLISNLRDLVYTSFNSLIKIASAYYADKGEINLKREYFLSDLFEDGESVIYTITKFRSNGNNLEFYVSHEDNYQGDYWIKNGELTIDNVLLLIDEILDLDGTVLYPDNSNEELQKEQEEKN